MEKQVSCRIVPNWVKINPFAHAPKHAGLGCPREEDGKLSAPRNRCSEVGSSENAVVAIGQRLQGFPELS
jgi:hypothetical protein